MAIKTIEKIDKSGEKKIYTYDYKSIIVPREVYIQTKVFAARQGMTLKRAAEQLILKGLAENV